MQLAPSPINVDILQAESYDYDTTESQFLVNGFRKGSSLKNKGPRKATNAKNLKSALKLPDIVLKKINKEVELCGVPGPFVKVDLYQIIEYHQLVWSLKKQGNKSLD